MAGCRLFRIIMVHGKIVFSYMYAGIAQDVVYSISIGWCDPRWRLECWLELV